MYFTATFSFAEDEITCYYEGANLKTSSVETYKVTPPPGKGSLKISNKYTIGIFQWVELYERRVLVEHQMSFAVRLSNFSDLMTERVSKLNKISGCQCPK